MKKNYQKIGVLIGLVFCFFALTGAKISDDLLRIGSSGYNFIKSNSGTHNLEISNDQGTTYNPIATTTGIQALTNKDFDGGTASNSLRLTIPKNSTTNISALTRKQGTIFFDTTQNLLVVDNGTTVSATSGIVTSWASGTCTSGMTTNTTTTCLYRRIGDSIDVRVKWTFTGSPGTTSMTVTIPTGMSLAIDTTKFPVTAVNTTLGHGEFFDFSSTEYYPLFVRYFNTTTVTVWYISGSKYDGVSNLNPVTIGNIDNATVEFTAPIVGW